MKRALWAALAMLLLLSATAAFCAMQGRGVERAGSGSPWDSLDARGETRLEGWRYDGEAGLWRYTLCLAREDIPLSLAILQLHPFEFFVNGLPVYRYGEADPYGRMHFVGLEDFAGQGVLELAMRIDPAPSENWLRVFIGPVGIMEALRTRIDKFSYFCLGLSALVMLYSLSLYLKKRSELYLLLLFVLACLLLLDTPLLPFSCRLHLFIYYYALVLMYLIRIWICTVLLDIKFTGSLGRLFKLKSALGVFMINAGAVALSLSGLIFVIREILPLVCAFVVVYACKNERRGAWILLLGYAVTQGLQLFMDANIVLDIPFSLLFYSFRVYKVIDTPFMLSVVLVTNLRYSEKFHAAEALARELDAANASLDAKVKEAREGLMREQQQKHNMMLNIFHDLRSPIFVMEGCLEMLQSGGESAPEAMGMLQDRLKFLGKLTEDLFLIAKFEDDKVFFAADPVDFSALCRRTMAALALPAQEKGIGLVGSIEDGCAIWGDMARLEQMLQNLILNAIHYTPEGGRVFLSLQAEGEQLHLKVADTGKGIAPEKIPFIFQRYYSAEQSDSAGKQSTGLGLSIAFEIAKHHKGNIALESQLGSGSVFTVVLPRLYGGKEPGRG